jgi:hypothetical protein
MIDSPETRQQIEDMIANARAMDRLVHWHIETCSDHTCRLPDVQ